MGEERTSAKPLSRRRILIQGALSGAIALAVAWVAADTVETTGQITLFLLSALTIAVAIYDIFSIVAYYLLKIDKETYEIQVRYGVEGHLGDPIPIKVRITFLYPFMIVIMLLMLSHASQIDDAKPASEKIVDERTLSLQP